MPPFVNKCATFGRSPASPALASLLAGHLTQAKMRAVHVCICDLYRVVARGIGPMWFAHPKRHTWQQVATQHLRWLGWRVVAAWTWQHPQCGTLDMTNLRALHESMHRVRESWRQQLFRKWSRSNRREVRNMPILQYDERRRTAARHAYKQGCVHARAVLTGGAVSDACFRS